MTRRDAEGPIHRAVLSWLRVVLPPPVIIHHSPNESRRPGRAGDVERAMNAANGAVAGFPDIMGLTFTGPFFMEVKAPGGSLSPAQRDFRDRLAVLGYGRWAVVRSIDDAKDALAAWGIPTREAGSLVRLPVRGIVK
jgi:phage tail protein X